MAMRPATQMLRNALTPFGFLPLGALWLANKKILDDRKARPLPK
jgi:hypothetical protein